MSELLILTVTIKLKLDLVNKIREFIMFDISKISILAYNLGVPMNIYSSTRIPVQISSVIESVYWIVTKLDYITIKV